MATRLAIHHAVRAAGLARVRSFLERFGYRVVPQTDQRKLRELIGRLRPERLVVPLIRIGGDTDGGYLLPDDLGGIAACLSPGVSDCVDFELHLASLGVASRLADYSVECPPVVHPMLQFERRYLGARDDHVYMRLDTWVASCGAGDGDLLLQMDIEGAEWEVLLATPREVLRRFRMLVIEFHGLDALADALAFPVLQAVFDTVLQDFAVAHLHPNNCLPVTRVGSIEIPPVMEFTFVRRDRGLGTGEAVQNLPHVLDRPCMQDRPDVALSSDWFSPRSESVSAVRRRASIAG